MVMPRFCCFLVLFLHSMFILPEASGRQLPAFPVNNHRGSVQTPRKYQTNHSTNEVMGIMEKTSKYKEMEKIGSRPPRCEDKCYGCLPCEAIQVPTTGRVDRPQYTNYQPEGWKCKCGPSFYIP